jgi:thiamine biosynthesis protein ThiS
MRITVNDQAVELATGASVSDLVQHLALPATRVAVEVNRRLVRRAEHGTTLLADGDTVEVVTLVGGG